MVPLLFKILTRMRWRSFTSLKHYYNLRSLLLLLLLLAQVTYNQVRPLRINYLASCHRVKLI